jgi:8-oxo-dGTP pyrophosphatase MutT (NUDIX family)
MRLRCRHRRAGRQAPKRPEGVTGVPAAGGWSALAAAQAHVAVARVPFCIAGVPAGSVARAHLDALRDLTEAGPRGQARLGAGRWVVGDDGVELIGPGAAGGDIGSGVSTSPSAGSDTDATAIEATLRPLNLALRAAGLVLAWRDEDFPLLPYGHGQQAAPVQPVQPWGRIERAACRFWGTLTRGAHVNGWVAGADGRPSHLWIARRSLHKATDPGLLDNLVGGGIGCDQTPLQTVVREAWEEAGLPAEIARRAQAQAVLGLHRDVPEGRMVEHLHVFDLALPAGLQPVNQDGEVAGFECLSVAKALALAREGAMTVDAALVTLDFALRHQLVADADAQHLGQAVQALRVG